MTERITLSGTVHEYNEERTWMDVDVDQVGRYWMPVSASTKPEVSTWGPSEIEAYTGRSKTRVQSWYRRGTQGFPAPRERIKAGPLWDAHHVKAWLRDNPEQMAHGSQGFVELVG